MLKKSLGVSLFLLLSSNPGSYAFAQVEEVILTESALRPAIALQKRNEEKLFEIPGVIGVGVGTQEGSKEPALHIYFNEATLGASAAKVPLNVEGLPVRFIKTDAFKALDGPPGNNHKQIFPLPVPMGVSTGNINGVFAGTLGYRVTRIGQSSNVGYITNNHVGSASGSKLCPAQLNPANLPAFGLDQCQPGRLDAPGNQCVPPVIGDLVQAVPIIMGGAFENTVDAVFVKSTRSLVDKKILDIGNPSPSTQEPAVNLKVVKSGRTTGFTTGTVNTINATVTVNYGSGCGVAKFVGQIIITPGTFSAAGDSGSPILTATTLDSAGRKKPVGLLFAGSSTVTIANRMNDVLGALHAQIDTQ